MKFALYQPWIYLHGGLERSILELIKRSRHDWTIFTGYYDPQGTFPEFRQLDVRVVGKTSVKRNFAGVLSSSINTLRVKLSLDESFDGLVVWCDGIGDLVTFRNDQLPIYNICSTPLRAAFDPVYQNLLMSDMSLQQRLLYRVFKAMFRAVDRRAWRKFDGIVATSTEVKNRILAGELANQNSRMVMAYPGISWKPEPPINSFEPMILVPGRIMWTKNIEQAIRAFLKSSLPAPWRLVIAGYVDDKSKTYLAELMALASGNANIIFVPCPTDATLLELYRQAAFCLFTPLNEDWGIVPLEAMAQGKPVIANARGGPLESIKHGHTGFLLEPNDEIWSDSIKQLSSDPALIIRLGQQAHEHVQKFTWERFATTVDSALEDWSPCQTAPDIVGSNAKALANGSPTTTQGELI